MKFLSLIYGLIVKVRNIMYDYEIIKQKKVDGVEIVCIGNIVVGGTGKTPAVKYFTEKFIKEGKRVAILSRGYKGKRRKDPYVVRDYEKIYASVLESGDESYLYALNFNIPVVVSKNRYEGAKYLKKIYNVDIIVMDDGFQHRRLYRNKNILLIDATNPFGNFEYLPKGKLRESLIEIKRADEIIISKSNYINKKMLDEIVLKIQEYNINGSLINTAVFKRKNFYNYLNENISLDGIENKKVLIFSSIANPKVFLETIKELNPSEIEQLSFRDHHIYNETEVENILKKGKNYDYIITTEKDIVKLNIKEKKLLVLKMEFDLV